MRDRQGEAWNDEDIGHLRRMAAQRAPLIEIARVLERTPDAVAARAKRLKVAIGN